MEVCVRLRERLSGQRLLVTGVTGFVGEALLERLLGDLPDTRVLALIRARGASSGTDRLAQLLAKPAFARLRSEVGLDALLARVEVVEGDLTAIPELPGDLDLVIHCAGEVSFDPPIDEGFATNLGGLRELVRAIHGAGGRPHLVHVSTAYVAGLLSGHVSEGPVPQAADWRAEEQASLRARQNAEDASRDPDTLAGFLAEATSELGRAGLPTIAAEAERRRATWVRSRLVDTGRERARTLGWTDCYTMTKALGERYLEEHRGGLPLSVVRPSIIESALTRPFPGWIEGFKMAEPLILAFGRGELPDFPAVPEAVIDIVPVDLVVNAILAAAAAPTAADKPTRYYQVCSGTANPLRFRELYEHVRDYFTAEPLIARGRGAIAVPVWQFAGTAALEARLSRGERGARWAGKALSALPTTTRTRGWGRDLERADAKLRFLRRYADLYHAYTQAQLVYDDANTRALTAALDPADQAEFPIDAAGYSWADYLHRHCASVTAGLRALSARPSRPPARLATPAPSGPLSEHGGRVTLAAFDLDGTLASTTVVESYLWMRLSGAPAARVSGELAGLLRAAPGWLRAERVDRGRLVREVYAGYAGADPDALARLVDEEVGSLLLSRASATALRRVREHRAAGHHTVLLTGSLDLLVRPLAPLFDEVVAARLEVGPGGRCTGNLTEPPLVAEARGAWVRFAARRLGADLAASWAYGDSLSDLPMLEAVGNPVAVNPDLSLGRLARRRRWPVEMWPSTSGTDRLAGLGRPADRPGSRVAGASR